MYTRSKSACRSRRPLRGNPGLPPKGDNSLPAIAFTAASHSAAGRDTAREPQREFLVKTAPYSPWGRGTNLFAEAGFHGNPLAAFGAAARQNLGSAFGLHPRAESVLLRALAPVGLESTFGHEKRLLLIRSIAERQTKSINDGGRSGKPGEIQTGMARPRRQRYGGTT